MAVTQMKGKILVKNGIKNGKQFIAVGALAISVLLGSIPANAQTLSETELQEKMEAIIDWKKEDLKQNQDEPLLSNAFLANAGNSVVDWYPFGMGRAGYPDDYAAYIAVIDTQIKQRYQQPQKLSDTKATEWHRIALAYLASGGDATNANGINLIADGTYNRGNTTDLGAQGINGLIWGLITLDTLRYDVPEDAYEQRADIIERIVSLQLENGGFSLDQKEADVDITAMALTALAPYYNDETVYAYRQQQTKTAVKTTVREATERALVWLSKQQQKDGDFKNGGIANLESTAQVIVALTSLHIDADKDPRFIKNGHTVIDGLLKYEVAEGGFMHAKTYSEDNPTSRPDESNSMASEQALYALVALYRQETDQRTLYDLRKEQSMKTKKAIEDAEQAIAKLKTQPQKVDAAIKAYDKVAVAERSYVDNYSELAKVAESVDTADLTANLSVNETISAFPTFFEATQNVPNTILKKDIEEVQALLKQQASTSQEVAIAKYVQQWKQAKNAARFQQQGQALTERARDIAQLKKQISALNERILDELYPFTELSLEDKDAVTEITAQYKKLPRYDQQQIVKYEDVEKAQTQIQSLQRARYLTFGGSGVVVVLITCLVFFKRRQKKGEHS